MSGGTTASTILSGRLPIADPAQALTTTTTPSAYPIPFGMTPMPTQDTFHPHWGTIYWSRTTAPVPEYRLGHRVVVHCHDWTGNSLNRAQTHLIQDGLYNPWGQSPKKTNRCLNPFSANQRTIIGRRRLPSHRNDWLSCLLHLHPARITSSINGTLN